MSETEIERQPRGTRYVVTVREIRETGIRKRDRDWVKVSDVPEHRGTYESKEGTYDYVYSAWRDDIEVKEVEVFRQELEKLDLGAIVRSANGIA